MRSSTTSTRSTISAENKGTYGHHPLTAWCDNTGESLALLLRPGNAGSNTVSDHITVLTEAIAQIPARYRRDLLITLDGAGATLELIRHISVLDAVPGHRVHYSVGFDLDHRGRAAIGRVPASAWEQVLDRDGAPRDPDDADEAGVVELTRRPARQADHPRHRDTMTDTDTARVRTACEALAATGADITFTAVAAKSGISRATCYRRRELRAIIDSYRSRHGGLLTLTGLADRVDNLTQALDAVAAKVRRQEEEIRAFRRRETPTSTRPEQNQTGD